MCDTFAANRPATLSGAVLFGKNSDREFDEPQYLEMIPATSHAPGSRLKLTHVAIDNVAQTNAMLISKPHWIWGAEIGANEHGLVIGNEAILAKLDPSFDPGIIGMDYVRLALERAATIEDAIDVITRLLRLHGQGGNCGHRREIAYHNSYLLADLNGVSVLETVDREWVVRSVPDFYAISNGLTVGADFDQSSATALARACEAGLPSGGRGFSFRSTYEDLTRSKSAPFRRERATALMRTGAGALTTQSFFDILRDHEEEPLRDGAHSGARLCAHRRDHPLGHTTASWVASLRPDKCVHWVTGTSAPCTGLFKPVLFETGLPAHGPAPGVEEDHASLWWRHEQLRRALDKTTAFDRAQYMQQRDALQAQFVAAMDGLPPLGPHTRRDGARDVVHACWRQALAFETGWLENLS